MGKLWMIGLLALVTVVEECKEATDPDSGVPTDLVGTWYASAFTFTNASNPAQSINVLTYGASFMLVVNEDGSYTATMTDPYSGSEVMTGTMTAANGQMTVVEDGETTTMTYTLVNGVFTLIRQGEEFDFDDNGVYENAVLTIVMSKTPPNTGGGTVPSEVVGIWDATSYVFVNLSNPQQVFDAITAGASWTITINSNGTFSGTWTDPGSMTPSTDTGTMVFSGNQVIATTADGPTVITWAVSGNTMVVMFQEPFDFDDNGTDEAASVTCTLTKR